MSDLSPRCQGSFEGICDAYAEIRKELANERCKGIHTCHAECPRPMCVLRREKQKLISAIRSHKRLSDQDLSYISTRRDDDLWQVLEEISNV